MKRKRSYYHVEEEETTETSTEKRKKKISWNEEAEFLLIQLWEEYIGTLRGLRKNSVVFDEMANIMINEGYNFTGEELRVKVHNLTNRYKLEKRNIEHNGGYSSWKYYDTVHSILSCKKGDGDATIKEDVESKVESKEEAAEEVPVGSEEQDQLEESMCSIEAIESYKPADNKEGRKRKRDDRRSANGSDILKMLRENTEIMKREAEDRRRADAKMLRLQEELVEIERERNDILKEMLR